MSLEQLPYLPLEEQEKLLNGPALGWPEGVVPNLDNHLKYDTGALVVSSLCIAFTALVFCVRGYIRWYSLRKIDASDCKPLFHLFSRIPNETFLLIVLSVFMISAVVCASK
jgi:hypothetical protein